MIFLWFWFNRKTKLRDGISSGLDIDSESSFRGSGQKHKLMKNEDEFEEKNSKLKRTNELEKGLDEMFKGDAVLTLRMWNYKSKNIFQIF